MTAQQIDVHGLPAKWRAEADVLDAQADDDYDKSRAYGTRRKAIAKRDDADELEAALRQSGEAVTWQPIETAPMDGKLFLGWVSAVRYGEADDGQSFEHDVSEHDFCRWREIETGGFYENMMGQIGDAQDITHWMPLPASPGSECAPPATSGLVEALRNIRDAAREYPTMLNPAWVAATADDALAAHDAEGGK